MTNNLTEELSRLNALDATGGLTEEEAFKSWSKLAGYDGSTPEMRTAINHAMRGWANGRIWSPRVRELERKSCAYDDAIALANKLHAENERLKALLGSIAMHAKTADGWEDGETFYKASIESIRDELHAAGIGGE